jgi:hypothetical protein
MGAYTIKPGDHLSALAEAAGFRSADTIWNAPENQKLRSQRDNPSVLAPGDSVFIPDKQKKTIGRSVDANHRFVAKVDKLNLRLLLLDFDNKPMPGLAATLTVDGRKMELTSGGDGAIQAKVPLSAKSGRLKVPDLGLDLELAVGHLDPPHTESGWRQRLVNLNYYRGGVTDDEDEQAKFWAWALEEFQCDHDLPVTGKPDDATMAKLKSVHES